ncbi:unnamed protein product [Closterium sp. NIES-64]|nr:unnamed protein product [Closterium sp. NIES-64]
MMTRPATTIAQLMLIRACHSEALRRHSLGTALGLRTRRGRLTDVPAIVVFVSRKVHEEWLLPAQKLPRKLQGPGGYECDVDVVELTNQRSGCRSSSSPGAAGHVAGDAGDVAGTVGVAAEAAIIDNPLVEQLRGSGSKIGPGSQIASEEVYGTLGAIVKKASRSNSSGSGSGGGGGGGGGGHGRTSGTGGMSSSLGGSSGCLGVGFLASRHVAVDLDQLKQKLFHPLPVSLGPGRFLGSVERALPFASDHAWFGVFANMNPDSFVRTDGAYIPFHEEFDLSVVTTQVAGIGPVGPPRRVNLSDDIRSVVGQHVWKVRGSASGLTQGTIAAYAVERSEGDGTSLFTDLLIVGRHGCAFDTPVLVSPRSSFLQVGSASGLTQGTIAAYAVEHSEGGGTSLFTDLLIVGRHGHAFDTQGDSGALVLMLPTAAHSPAVLASLQLGAQQCSSAVELARLLSLLDLEMVTTDGELREFALRQRLLRTPGNSSPTPGHGARGSADEIGRGERGRGEEIAELEKKEEEEGKEGAEESVGKRQRVEGGGKGGGASEKKGEGETWKEWEWELAGDDDRRHEHVQTHCCGCKQSLRHPAMILLTSVSCPALAFSGKFPERTSGSATARV